MRNPFTWIAVACVGAIALVAALDGLRSWRSASPPPASTPEAATTPVTTEEVTTAPLPTAGATTDADDECADPTECTEDWTRAVAEAAGFRITEHTGSAWVAVGRGKSFYICATNWAAQHQLDDEGFRIVRRIDGVPIFDDGIRLAWSLDRLTVWAEPGPTENSVGPKPGELRRLVRASETITFA